MLGCPQPWPHPAGRITAAAKALLSVPEGEGGGEGGGGDAGEGGGGWLGAPLLLLLLSVAVLLLRHAPAITRHACAALTLCTGPAL